jgi:hypothetical protein
MMIDEHSTGGDLILICDLGKCFALLSAMPGRKRWQDRRLIFEPSGANLSYVMQHWPDAEWRNAARQKLDAYIALKQQEQNTRDSKLDNVQDASGYAYETEPYKHQRRAFVMSRDRLHFALFHEQGCGKSKVFIDTMAYLWERKKIDTVVIIAPNGVHRAWLMHHIPTHMPKRIAWIGDYYSSKKTPKQLQEIRDLVKDSLADKDRTLPIITFNVDGFVSEKAQALMNHVLATGGNVMMIVDESQRIKNPSAKRTKFILSVARKAKYRRIGTGTPVTKGAENLFSQFKFLDSRILGYESFYTFRAHYCIMGGFENRAIVAYKNIDELVRIVDGQSDRVLKKDCLDLPPKIYKRIPFELSPEQRRLYNAIKRSAVEELEQLLGEENGRKKAAELAIVKLLRLRQITCGWMPQETPERIPGAQPRMEAMLSLLETHEDEKMVIWAGFRNDLEVLQQLPQSVAYWGKIKEKQRDEALRKFINDPACLRFVANPQSAGTGTDGLQVANIGCYYSNSYDLDLRLQSEERLPRPGARGEHILLYDLEAIKTIDQPIVSALRKKKALADQITQDPISVFMEESI